MTAAFKVLPAEAVSDLARDLLRPTAYPTPHPNHVELRETHVSRVFMTESDVYKIKKPVHFAFLDFSTLGARRRACEAEIQLNSRLAASVYLGVVPVRRDAAGRHHFGTDGEVVDWAVHMLRLPDHLRMDRRLARGALTAAQVEAVASHIANFHARARCDETTAKWGAPAAIATNITENFAEVDAANEGLLSAAQGAELERVQLAFLNEHGPLFEERRRSGRVREGHGDLRLEQIYIGEDDSITVLDCIEFSDRFRCADVCSDIAFLSMDLAAHGRVDLAERCLARYARSSGDYGLYGVIDFYESYRAYVRGKVAVLTARNATARLRQDALADARRYFALALAAGRRPMLGPVVVSVGGIIASGKSTVATALAERLWAPLVDADRTRKELAGLAPLAHDTSAAFEGLYTPAVTDTVYAEVMRRAAIVLESGRPVVIDASFHTAAMRAAARDLAAKHGVPFSMVECRARPEVCRSRLERREKESTVSDGRLAIFDAFCARAEPFSELLPETVLVVDTERPLGDTLAMLENHLETWPRELKS